jgi:pyruvate-ferredoxin/flavodoxin oxidoreductase
MAAYGKAQHGKTEARKELALIAIAHRGAYVHQTSQASASHLVAGVLRGLQKRRPAIINIYTPCPVEHGLADDWASSAAKLALESRAFPFITYDPDAGPLVADALSLEGNPAIDERWPRYNFTYVDDAGATQRLQLPLTIADWAASEGRFRKHFTDVPRAAWDDEMVPFHEFIDLSAEDRAGKTPFIHTKGRDGTLARLAVAPEIVRLAEERLEFWAQLKELAGLEPAASVRERIVGDLTSEYEAKLSALRDEYETKLADMRTTYPRAVARRLAEALLRGGGGGASVAELLAKSPNDEPQRTQSAQSNTSAQAASLNGGGAVTKTTPQSIPIVSPVSASSAPSAVNITSPVAVAPSTVATADDGLTMEAYIDSARCTSCNECINLNGKLFGYDESKQATVKDPHAGTFQQLVLAAERCPVGIIHPGTPLNPKEKDLPKWIKRAEPFT